MPIRVLLVAGSLRAGSCNRADEATRRHLQRLLAALADWTRRLAESGNR
jgi:hypothetical protein